MSYQADLVAAIEDAPKIAAIVGTRIYADFADGSAAAPFIVYQTITSEGETTHDGNRNLIFPLIQITAWSETRAQAIELAAAITEALEGKTLFGLADLTLTFLDQHGERDADTNLFSEIIEFRGHCNTNLT